MCSKTEQPLSFFKVLIETDFNQLLRIPRAFMRKHGSIFPKNVKLRVESGKSWDVKVEAFEDGGLFCFKSGWNVFANDVGLVLGEFVEFVLNDDGFTLDVAVYESNACERENPEVQDDDHDDDDDGLVFVSASAKEILKPLYCGVTLKFHQRSRVTLKRGFSKAAGLAGKERVRVVGKHHREWIELDHRGGSRIDLSKGWHEFRLANALQFGKTYSFEFKPTKNAIHVKEVKLRN